MQGAIEALTQTCDESQEQDNLVLAKQLRRMNDENKYVPKDTLEELIHHVEFPEPNAQNIDLIKQISVKIDSLRSKLECLTKEAILDNKPHRYLERCVSAGGELGRQKRKAEKDLRLAESLAQSSEDKEEREYIEKCRAEYRAGKARRLQADSQAASSCEGASVISEES
jgi:intein/homing endonuclease